MDKISLSDNKNKTGENHSNSSSKLGTKNANIETINKLVNSNISLFKSRSNYELMYEAFYISNLFYEMTNTKYHLKDSYFYILSLEWFSKWKKYVNYDFYTNPKNYKKFILINKLPFRPKDINQENYLKNIRPDTKKKIFDFFDKFFLGNNINMHPGFINNKKFIKTQLKNNYNVGNEFKYGEHYIWVTEDIWKYLFCMYGGFEIRRRNLYDNNDYYLIQENINNQGFNIIVEAKLKTYNLILFHNSKNHTYKIDPPQYFFISHCSTISELKKKIKNYFPVLNRYCLDDIHLFFLEQNMNVNTFANYMKINAVNNYKKMMTFPGISLDLFNSNLTLEYIEEKHLKIDINNITNLVLEIPFYLKEKNRIIFLFENQTNMKIYNIENIENNDYNKPYYDKIKFEDFEENNDFIINEKLFLIKKYFYQKYFIDKITQCQKCELNIHLKRIIDNFNDEQLKKIFNVEIEELRNNMDLIFDKNYLASNISDLYLSEFNKELYNNSDSNNNKLINKKREREINDIIDLNSNDDNDIFWYTCGFCKNALNQNCLVCKFCKKKKYCNYLCRSKDIKEHLFSCGI